VPVFSPARVATWCALEVPWGHLISPCHFGKREPQSQVGTSRSHFRFHKYLGEHRAPVIDALAIQGITHQVEHFLHLLRVRLKLPLLAPGSGVGRGSSPICSSGWMISISRWHSMRLRQ
jgi:hypothetical protein